MLPKAPNIILYFFYLVILDCSSIALLKLHGSSENFVNMAEIGWMALIPKFELVDILWRYTLTSLHTLWTRALKPSKCQQHLKVNKPYKWWGTRSHTLSDGGETSFHRDHRCCIQQAGLSQWRGSDRWIVLETRGTLMTKCMSSKSM